MRWRSIAVLSAFLLLLSAPANAGIVVLTFEGLQDREPILNYYNGGTGGLGSGPGPAWGITFGPDSLALIDFDAGGTGSFANEPSPSTVAFFLSGPGVIMDVAGGFTTGLSFFYSASQTGSVTVYDGPGGTGNLLATLPLAVNYNLNCTGDPNGGHCHWDPVGVAFGGTALSVSFAGAANHIGFDDVTLGSTVPSIPEPGTWSLIAGGLLALAGSRLRLFRK